MAASWEKVNPANSVDFLPQPYRSINKILEDILQDVGVQIGEIEAKRRSEEYEHALRQVNGTGFVAVSGRITAAYTEPHGTPRIVLGTSSGEVLLIDTGKEAVVAQKNAFDESEAVHCVVLCSDGAYAPRPWRLGQVEQPLPKPCMKLLVAGTTTPRILVFNVCKETYGMSLKPACAIHAPRPPDAGEAGGAPIVQQLHARGTYDGIWVLALMCNRSIRLFLCPLGAPVERAAAGGEAVLDKPIMEDEEEDEDRVQSGEDFAGVLQVSTPTYAFALQSLAPLQGLPEPGLDRVYLTVFAAKVETRSIADGTSARLVPLICMASSPDSNVVVGYSVPAPTPLVAPAGLDLDGLLRQAMPPMGELREPKESLALRPRRRWELPAETTSVAASPSGGVFAVGGAKGMLVLIDTAAGLSLRTMLPGHYAAVTGLAFHRCQTLVSVGADSWVHHYSMQDNSLLARYMCAPPPKPPPAQGVTASQQLALAVSLDANGGLRLLDLRRGQKIARPVCYEVHPPDPEPVGELPSAAPVAAGTVPAVITEVEERPLVEERPRRVLASSTGFCMVCEARLEELKAAAGSAALADVAGPEGYGDTEEAEEIDRSWLVMFDYAKVLKALYPGIKAERGLALAEAFNAIPPDKPPKELAPPAPPEVEVDTSLRQPLGGGPKTMTFGGRAKAKAKAANVTAQVFELTAENLRKITKASPQVMPAKGSVMLSSAGALRSMMTEEDPVAANGGKESKRSPHEASENWQVSVRRYLRSGLADREARQRRIQNRLDQIRKDLGDT